MGAGRSSAVAGEHAPREAKNTVSAKTAGATRVATAWLAVTIASLIGFVAITLVVWNHIGLALDKELLADAVAIGSPLKLAWQVLSEVGNYPMIPTAILFVIWLFRRGRKREAALVVGILIVATITNEGVKALVARDRPMGPDPGIPGVVYSYPSGHAWEDVMILGMVAVRLWRSAVEAWIRVGFAVVVTVLAGLIGFARMALDLHFPSDVLAGYIGGLLFLGSYAWGSRPGSWADHPREPVAKAR